MLKTIVLALAATFAVTSAQAAPVCFPWKQALAEAKARFGEVPTFVAKGEKNDSIPPGVVTITLSPTGSWTAWLQQTADVMCVLVTGTGWAPAPPSVRDAVPEPQPQQFMPWHDGAGRPAFLYPIGG